MCHQMKIKILISCLLVYGFGFSQSHKATLSKIEKDGFHKIAISPEIRSASQDNLAYFRILDESKKEVPYVVFDNEKSNAFIFNKIEKVEKTSIIDSVSSYIIPIHEYKMKYCSELSLLISNSKLEKKYRVSGSYDSKNWFGLVSNQLLVGLNNDNGTSVEKIISFPQNNYKFLRIDFFDKNSLPINIIDIGFNRGEQKTVFFDYINDFKYRISEDKKRKKTIITFSSDNFQRVDGISFDIKTRLFIRNANVFVNTSRKVKKRTENFKEEISSFNLNSNTSNVFQLNGFFEKEFTIEIDNQDNQPLEISKIKLFQNAISVVADLKANEKYEVIIDSTLFQPNYDLANFTENFTSELPKATISNIEEINLESKDTSGKAFWQQPVFLWSAILLALALLAYFVFSMLKEVEKK